MTTQKQAIQELLNSLEYPEIKKYFICSFLEDINWHRECALFQEKYFTELDKRNIEEIEKFIKDRYADPTSSIGKSLLRMKAYNFQSVHGFYRALNTIFGWGTDHDCWSSGGSGEAFADELYLMLDGGGAK